MNLEKIKKELLREYEKDFKPQSMREDYSFVDGFGAIIVESERQLFLSVKGFIREAITKAYNLGKEETLNKIIPTQELEEELNYQDKER
jgi:hypothetical protein